MTDEANMELDELVATLAECAVYFRDAGKKESLEHQRKAMFGSLTAVVKFLRSFPPFHEAGLHEPLQAAMHGVADLIDGIQPEIFHLETLRNADGIDTRNFKFNCAVALDALMVSGMKRMDAARHIKRLLPDMNLTANTIADWRDQLSGNAGDKLSASYSRVTKRNAATIEAGADVNKIVAAYLKGMDKTRIKLRMPQRRSQSKPRPART